MSKNNIDVIEETAIWLEKSGFIGDLSTFTAGLHDIREGIDKIYNEFLPSLLQLNISQKDEALKVIVDVWLEMEHISHHVNTAASVVIATRDFLDGS